MSHIISSEKDIKLLSQQLEKIRSKEYTDSVLEEILYTLVPCNKHFPIYVTPGEITAFDPYNKRIIFSIEEIKRILNKQLKQLTEEYPNLKKELYDNYTFLALIHEIEHYYQFLIAKKYVIFPYQIVSDGYKNLFDIENISNHSFATLRIMRLLYYSRKEYFFLERNANVEAYDALLKIADYENNKDLLDFLYEQFLYQLSLGYDKNYNGSMEKSYLKTGKHYIYKSFNHDEEIPIQDKIRYGLPIDTKTKKKVLNYEFNIKI